MKGLLTSLMMAAMVGGQLTAQVPQVDASKLSTKIPMDSQIRTGKLSNGLTYYIRQNDEPEDFIEFRLAVKVGALQEDADQNGIAHFTEHLLFNGTEKYPENKLLDFLEKTGARFGADINAYTNHNETVYMIPISNEEGNLEKGVEILSEWASKALLEHKEIDAERGVIISEYRQRRDAMGRLQDKLAPISLYGGKHIEHDIIGDTSLLQTAPYEAFERFYGDWYIPQNQAVVIVGDIDVDKTEKLVKQYFSDIENPANPREIKEYPVKANEGIIAGVATDPEMPYTRIDIDFKKEAIPDDGTIGTYRRGYIDRLIGSMMRSRVQELVSTSSNPPFQNVVAFNSEDGYVGVGSFTVVVIPQNSDILGGMEKGLDEVYRAYQHGFTASELQRAKEEALAGYETGYNKRNDTPSGDLAMEYVRNFLDNEAVPGIAYEYALAQQFTNDITLDEINARFKSYVSDENITVTLMAPENPMVTVPSEDELIAVVKNAGNKQLSAYEDDTEGMEFFTKKLTPGTISAESTDEKTGVTTFVLSNGVTVKVKPTDFKADEIIFSAYSPGGTSLVSDADFQNARYSTGIVNQSGLGEFDASTLGKLLAGKNANVSPYITELSEGFSGYSTKKDLETMMQLLHMYFTDPTVNEAAFESWRTNTIEDLKQRSNQPMAAFQDTLRNFMSGYHFRNRPVTEETISSLDMNKAFEIYKERFADANDFTYYIVGDVDLNELRPMLETYMATLPVLESSEKWVEIERNEPTGNIQKDIFKGIDDKAIVYMSIDDEFDYSRKNLTELKLLETVVDFAMTKRLREEKGGVYSPGVWTSSDFEPEEEYQLAVYFSCDPGRVDELVQTVKDFYKEVKEKGTKADDLEKFLKQEETQFDLYLKNNRAWSSWIQSADRNGITMQEYLDYKKELESLKIDDIKRVANKYVNEDELKIFVMYPTDYGKN